MTQISRPQKLPEFLTQEEALSLLAGLKTRSRKLPDIHRSIRNQLIVRLMVQLGARVGEVVGLKIEDIDFESGRIRLFGKGRRRKPTDAPIKKERIVIASPSLLSVIERYMENVGLSGPNLEWSVGYLFKISVRQVQHMLTAASVGALGRKVHPHQLRHTFATSFLGETGDIPALQRILGHASINTTMIYAHLIDTKVEKSMIDFQDKFIPGPGRPQRKSKSA